MACRRPCQEARLLPQDPSGVARLCVARGWQAQAHIPAARKIRAREPDGRGLKAPPQRPRAAARYPAVIDGHRMSTPIRRAGWIGYADFASHSLWPSRTKASKVFGLAPPIFSIVSVAA